MKPIRVDVPLLIAILLLIGLGVVLVYSSSWALAERTYGDEAFFLRRQGFFALLSIGTLTAGALIDPRLYERHAYTLLGLAFILLVLVLIPGVGPTIGIARRWIAIGPFNLQAGEVAKVALVVYLAMSIKKKADRMSLFSVGVVPHLLIPGALIILLLLEPDFGTASMLSAVTVSMLFVGGARLRYLAAGVALIIPAGILLIASSPYRMKRVLAFLDPWAHRQDIGYQVTESLMTFGSGGLTGLGIGDGRQKLFFLPAAHTDFIFAVLGEEAGFIGVLVVVAAFAILLVRGIGAAITHPDRFSALLAAGLTVGITAQALFNMAVVLGLVPTKGLTLPFVSYGGSSLLVSAFIGGIILRISGETPSHERAIP
jgi:cell division protein FtsW